MRKFVFGTLLASGCAGMLLLFFDEVLRQKAAARQQTSLDRIEWMSSGSLAPEVSVEQYVGPNQPAPPSLTFEEKFPGVIMVKFENRAEYPIYEMSASLFNWRTNGQMTTTAERFNSKRHYWQTFLSRKSQVILLPADIDSPWVAYEFYVHTKRGSTKHIFRFALLETGWEYAKQVVDLATTNTISEAASERFPRDGTGKPVMSLAAPKHISFPTISETIISHR